jgi:hypothetical protein
LTGPQASARDSAARWLTAQTVVFGAMAALLGVAANAMFLGAYGSAWLPVTYIAIAVAGVVVSGAVARMAAAFDLVRTALFVLGGATVLLVLAWAIAVELDGVWVSAPLLVLFPILIQLGFVFVGGQAGRLLDIAGIKSALPRILAGFSVGAVIGATAGAPLVSLLGRTEGLLLVTAALQAGFTGLVWATSRRHAQALARPEPAVATSGASASPEGATPAPTLRRLLGARFLALLLGYQVLSALASQIADFLVFDRASAAFPDSVDLARFVAGYTAVMNVVAIAFLVLLAGPLLRRYGLRVGVSVDPLVVTGLAIAMFGILIVAGAGSTALLAIAAATRIADIALTDGTTRTSINALYQVLPERSRLPVQATVEGTGVPIAIGMAGLLILGFSALPFALAATIAALAIFAGACTWVATGLYRAYGPALADALRRHRLLDPDARLEVAADDLDQARRLLASADLREARLGRELLATASTPGIRAELGPLADDPRPDVRMPVLGVLASAGDERARARLAVEARADVGATDPRVRARAAHALGVLEPADRAAAAALLVDADVAVCRAALEAVRPGDAYAVDAAIAALEDPRTEQAAAGALDRLGEAVNGRLAEALGPQAHETSGADPAATRRLVRALRTPSAARDAVLLRHVGHRDRELGLDIMEQLAGPARIDPEGAGALDSVLAEDARHAARVLAALDALDADDAADAAPDAPEAPLRRALVDELGLLTRRIVEGRLAVHGTERLGPPLRALVVGGRQVALAVEAIEVALPADEARTVLAVARPARTAEERRSALPPPDVDAPMGAAAWLRDLAEDPQDRWRSPWLRACAIRAARLTDRLDGIELDGARRLGDPIVDEELAALVGSG